MGLQVYSTNAWYRILEPRSKIRKSSYCAHVSDRIIREYYTATEDSICEYIEVLANEHQAVYELFTHIERS